MLTNWLKLSLDLVNNLAPLVSWQLKILLSEGLMNFQRLFLKIFKLSELWIFWSSLHEYFYTDFWPKQILRSFNSINRFWEVFFFQLKLNKNAKTNRRFQKILHHCLVKLFLLFFLESTWNKSIHRCILSTQKN